MKSAFNKFMTSMLLTQSGLRVQPEDLPRSGVSR